jgi:hypothetical protein
MMREEAMKWRKDIQLLLTFITHQRKGHDRRAAAPDAAAAPM